MMNDRNLIRGLFLIAVALTFGLSSLRYQMGDFSRAGPGLFPLVTSSLLLLIGIITVARSRFVAPLPTEFKVKNIAIILVSLCGFSVMSKYALITPNPSMVLGILFMVFCASFAGTAKYSIVRNLLISAGLIAVAFVFQKLLGFNLPLY